MEMTIARINATFTAATFTASTEAIISTVDDADTFTEIARLNVVDLGTIAPADHDQGDIMDGLNAEVTAIAARLGMTVTDQDGDAGNYFWTVTA